MPDISELSMKNWGILRIYEQLIGHTWMERLWRT